MQIARETGRAIYHNISTTKTCRFGENEKLIKGVFDKYRELCTKSKLKPILLFNEADGIFAKKKDSGSSSIAQTENTIQDNILEEMEKVVMEELINGGKITGEMLVTLCREEKMGGNRHRMRF